LLLEYLPSRLIPNYASDSARQNRQNLTTSQRPLVFEDETLPIQLLTTVPGIGLTLAVVIALEIGDVTRFPTAEKLASYAGCTCRIHASGDKLRYGRLRPDATSNGPSSKPRTRSV
jgi:transposase